MRPPKLRNCCLIQVSPGEPTGSHPFSTRIYQSRGMLPQLTYPMLASSHLHCPNFPIPPKVPCGTQLKGASQLLATYFITPASVLPNNLTSSLEREQRNPTHCLLPLPTNHKFICTSVWPYLLSLQRLAGTSLLQSNMIPAFSLLRDLHSLTT